MKIYSETEKGFLIEATKDEIANLYGAYSSYHIEYKKNGIRKEDIRPGLVIDVRGAYERLHWLDHHESKTENLKQEVHRLKNCLDKMLSALDNTSSIFKIAKGEDSD